MIVIWYHKCFPIKKISLIFIHIFVVGCTVFKFEVIVGRNNAFNLLYRILPAKVTWPRNLHSRPPPVQYRYLKQRSRFFRSEDLKVEKFEFSRVRRLLRRTDRRTDRQTDSTHDGVDLTRNHRGPFVRDGPTACLCIPYSDTQHTVCSTASFLNLLGVPDLCQVREDLARPSGRERKRRLHTFSNKQSGKAITVERRHRVCAVRNVTGSSPNPTW